MASQAIAGIGVGTVVADSYEVTGLLGRGGMGAVWAARHLRLPGKRVAIKVLLHGSDDPQALGRFKREAEIASRIGHPNIVEVLDFNTLPDGTPYQVLEYLDGESLAARLKRERLPLPQVMELARQMGSALLAAHRAGVVHRDLKPENIVLCRTDSGGVLHDRVKILDFGISKIRGSQSLQTQDAVLIGTPQYMSPEQATGKNQTVDHRTDVFALGAIIYEMLSGTTAFAGDSVVAVVMDVVHGTPTSLTALAPALPAAVVAAVDRAMAKAPADRFQDVGAFIAALTGRPLETLSPPPSTPGVPPVTPSRPLSAEEVMAATQAPSSGWPGGAPPPVAVASSSAERTAPERGAGAPATTTEVRRRRSAPVVIGGVALAVMAVAVVLFAGRDAGSPVVVSGKSVTPPPSGPLTAGQGGEGAKAPAPHPDPLPAAAGRGRPEAEGKGGALGAAAVRTARRDDDEVPAVVAAQLGEGERLLDGGDAGEAIRRARQSFFVRKTVRGWSLLARAFCRKGDLENARASVRNIPPRAAERARVLRDCRKGGIDLR